MRGRIRASVLRGCTTLLHHVQAAVQGLGSSRIAYPLAVFATALMLLLRWALDPLLGNTAQFLFFYFPVILVAFVGGIRPGMVTAVLGALAGTWLFVHLGHVGPTGWAGDVTRIAGFLLFAGLAALLVGQIAKARDEAAARGREEQFRSFFDSAAVGAAQVDANGRLVQVNDRYCQITGYGRQELLSLDPLTLVHPDDRQRERESLNQFLRGRRPTYGVEARLVRKDGRIIWVRATVGHIREPGDAPIQAAVIVEDVTARKEADAALRDSETKYRIVADNTYAWEFWISPEGDFLYNSPSCLNVTGYEVEAFKADPDLLLRIIHPDDRALYDQHRGFGGHACVSEDIEFRIIRKNGTVRWIHHTCLAVYGDDGQFLGIRGTNRDVTASRQMMDALRESEQKFRALTENAPAAIGIVQGTRFVYANRQFADLAGCTEQELLSTDFPSLVHPDYRDMMIDRARRRLSGESVPNHYEFLMLTKSGEGRWIDFSPALIDYQGKPAIIGAGLDVTDRKNKEEELRAARRSAERARHAAEEATRAKDRFMAVLSHELRTPLTPVLAAVSLLQKNAFFDERTLDGLEMIRRNVELEARLIDDLLDLTRIVRGKIELDKRPVALCTVISRAVEVCRPDIEARGLHFGVDLGKDAPYVVDADIGRLQQVFWNLLKNAIKFTPHDGCVGVHCRPDGEAGVAAEVIDSGAGIEAEVLPRIFDAFAQADLAITRQFGGLGLGLAITKSLVELHGGTIEAYSEGKGKGAKFTVRLPRISAPVPLPVQQPTPPIRQQRVLRLLVIEDHGDTADMMRLMLESEGHEVTLAGDVQTALQKAGQSDFDLLISDLGLPDGSGLDLMRELRARGHKLPAIALSGYGQDSDVQQSRAAGFVAHVTKPIDLDRLASVLADVTSRFMSKT